MESVEETLGPGALLDGTYRLKRRLGVGGHGTVWLADDEAGRHGRVAVKLLSSRLAASEDVRRRFRAEAAILRTLHHSGIVRALDFAADGQRLYIVMEYLDGRSLAEEMVDRARRGEPFHVEEIVARFRQVCDAVGAAHAQGVVHRDLKPQNVFVLGEGEDVTIKVLDFGIAKILGRPGEDATTLGRMLGSYLYTSPEQVSSLPVDGRADVFALGCVLFEMLTLRRAWAVGVDGRAARVGDRSLRFEGPNAFLSILRRIVAGHRPVPTEYRAELPEEIDGVVARALEVTPEQRYGSVDALREALLEVTTSRHPALVGEPKLFTDPSLPRLPVATGDVPPDAGLVEGGHVIGTEAEMHDTSVLPPPTRIVPTRVQRPTPWALQLMLIVLGGMMGALAYHLVIDSARRPPVTAGRPRAPEPAPSARPRSAPAVHPDPSTPDPAGAPPGSAAGALEGPATPYESEAPAARRPRGARAAVKGPSEPRPPPYAGLRADLRRLKIHADVDELDALVRAIEAAARGLDDEALAQRIERLAVASAATGDLDGLAQCIALLTSAH